MLQIFILKQSSTFLIFNILSRLIILIPISPRISLATTILEHALDICARIVFSAGLTLISNIEEVATEICQIQVAFPFLLVTSNRGLCIVI